MKKLWLYFVDNAHLYSESHVNTFKLYFVRAKSIHDGAAVELHQTHPVFQKYDSLLEPVLLSCSCIQATSDMHICWTGVLFW